MPIQCRHMSMHCFEEVAMFPAVRWIIWKLILSQRNRMTRYITESMISDDVRQRELEPLQRISDNYEKIILSMNTGMDASYEGIKSINLCDWLLAD